MEDEQTQEMRHILGFVQSHLDKYDVRVDSMDYDVTSHTDIEPTEVPDPDFSIEGKTVEVELKYTFPYEE